MKPIQLYLTFLSAVFAVLHAAEERPSPAYGQLVEQRLRASLDVIAKSPAMTSTKSGGQDIWKAMLLFHENKDIAQAERSIVAFCGKPLTKYIGKFVPENRTEAVFRIYLTEKLRGLLSKDTKTVIEDYAWLLLTEHNRGVNRALADKPFWDFGHNEEGHSENHYVNDRRRYLQALQVVRLSERYGPNHKLEGESIESHCQAWNAFWIRYFQARAGQGTDMEIAHPSSYGSCTVGVYYDLYDLTDSQPLRELAGKFLTLYWAEVAAEFEPRTGERALAATRNPFYDGERLNWARSLLYCYGWRESGNTDGGGLGNLPFLMSSYRPPEILRAIASDPKRGPYQATSRRALMIDAKSDTGGIVFDEKGDGHFRRDVFYTPDYMLSTMTLDPSRQYHNVGDLAQTMGVKFASGQKDRIVVTGTGFYAKRAISGITGNGVSIIARDPNAEVGRGRFMSEGTRVFVRNDALWDNRVEDASGWFFTRANDAYAAIRMPGGYTVSTRTYIWPDRKLQEVEEKHGRHLELKDMWAPIVIQMGRAADYKSFEAFQTSVKARKFEYENSKLTYVSEAGETIEYWAKGTQIPKINGTTVNLNPAKTYDCPYLSMEHGQSKAVIHCPGYKDEVLEFGSAANPEAVNAHDAK
ncbi:MAG: hypothetical protein WCT04_22360 [Planctomycetota bacterium]